MTENPPPIEDPEPPILTWSFLLLAGVAIALLAFILYQFTHATTPLPSP